MIQRLVVTLLLTSSIAYATPQRLLDSGHYTAQVTAMPCGACAPAVEKAMLAQPEVQAASVDLKSLRLIFIVKNGATVSLATLQKSLKEASDSMGMGADYRLRDVQKMSLTSSPEVLPSPAAATEAPPADASAPSGCSTCGHH